MPTPPPDRWPARSRRSAAPRPRPRRTERPTACWPGRWRRAAAPTCGRAAPRDVDLLQRRALLGLVELGDLVLAHHALEQRFLQLQLAPRANVVDRRLRNAADRHVDRAAGCAALARLHSRQLGAQPAQFRVEAHHRWVLLGSGGPQHLQLDFALADLGPQQGGIGDQRLGLLVEDDDARLLLHGLQRLLRLDEILLGLPQLLLEERAAQLSLGDRDAAEQLGHLGFVRIGEVGGELRVLVVDFDADHAALLVGADAHVRRQQPCAARRRSRCRSATSG